MTPRLSYTIWFSQRTGSSLLTTALESTGIAGVPHEWLNTPDLFSTYQAANHAELQSRLWEVGTTPNGVFGLKHSFHEPHFTRLTETFRKFPTVIESAITRPAVWESAFPHHLHIFITRRNKVRLAVSWWKAIQSQEWHRRRGEHPKSVDLSNAYSFDAINHLYNECSMREAGIQEFFSEGNIIPLNIFYEDFILEYEQTIRTVLTYLEVDSSSMTIDPPLLDPTADSVSEEWVQRFRQELQSGWQNRGW